MNLKMVKCAQCSDDHTHKKKNGELTKKCDKCRQKEKDRVAKKRIPDENGLFGCIGCMVRLKPEEFSYNHLTQDIIVRCFQCQEKQKESLTKKRIPDEDGLIGCMGCKTRLNPVEFPDHLQTGEKTKRCIKCLDRASEEYEKRVAPFKAQVEQYRRQNPYHEGVLIEDDDDHFDHDPKKGKKIKEVTKYHYWTSSKAGFSLEERLENHRLELEKCQRVPVSTHRKLTKERIAYSTKKGAIYSQKVKEIVKEENWKFIQWFQNEKCGCGCGQPIHCDAMEDIEFDHQEGKKEFAMAEGYEKSESERTEERKKGKFLFSKCHRRLTRKRRKEKREERNKRMKIQ